MNFILRNQIVLFREMGTFNRDIFDLAQSYMHRHYYYYHQTLEDCVIKSEPTCKRKVVYCLSFIIMIIHTIYLAILITYPDSTTQALLGDPIFEFITQYRFVNGVWLCISIIILGGKFAAIYYELLSKINCMKMLYDLFDGTGFYRLNKDHEDRILLWTNLCYWLMMRSFNFFCFFYVTLIYTTFRIIAYFYSTYQFNIFTLVLMTIQQMVCLKIIIAGTCGGLTGFYIIISFLIYKIDEIIDDIKISIRWRNKIKLIKLIGAYDTFNKMFHQINTPINVLLSVCYMTMPYMASNLIKILRWKTDSIIEICLKLITIGIFYGAICNIIIVNFYISMLTFKNNSIPRHFYRLISNINIKLQNVRIESKLSTSLRQITYIKFILKIQLFIMRFRYELVGFRLFN